MRTHRISTETKKFISQAERVAFMNEINFYKEKGIKEVFLNIRIKEGQDNLDNYFFVFCRYLAIQDQETMKIKRGHFDAVRHYLIDEFLVVPRAEHKTKGGKTIISRKALKNANKEQKIKFIECIVNWAVGQGYEVPNSEEYGEMLKDKGKSLTKQYFDEKLEKLIRAKYGEI